MKSICFVDPPSFCTTVERLVAPALKSRPVAVAPPGADRATVLALSSEAEAAGVTRGMLVRHARKLCPDLVLLPPNPRLYARASRALGEILRIYAPVIEPQWYGHAFLDLSGTERLFGPASDVAERIRREARERLRLPLLVGVAGNKLVSQAAARVGWSSSIPPGGEAPFLAPHLLSVLPDVPEDIRLRLDEYQLERIGQVAAISESELCAVFGGRGRLLCARARGIDARPVLPPEVKAEYRLSHTLGTDTNDLAVLHPLLRRLAAALGQRLRARGLAARRFTVQVEHADYTSAARSVPLAALPLDQELWEAAKRALALALARRIAVRTVTLTADRLVEVAGQLELWEEPADTSATRKAVLQRALDAIHNVNRSPALLPGQDEFADAHIPLHRAVRDGGVGHGEDRMNHRAQHAVPPLRMIGAAHGLLRRDVGSEERQDPFPEFGGQCRAFFRPARAHHAADDLEPLPQDQVEAAGGSLRALQKTQQHQPPPARQQRQIVLERGPTQHIEDQVDGLAHLLPEAPRAGVDAHVEAQRAEPLELRGGARGAQHDGTDSFGELNRRGTDTARHRVNQHPLAWAQPPARVQRVIGGEEGFGNRGGVAPGHPGGHQQRFVFRDHNVLRVPAAPHQSHHPVARLEPGDAWPERVDFPGIFQPGNLRGPAGRSGISSAALQDVGAVQSGGPHANPNLVVARHGIGRFAERNNVDAACAGIADGSHVERSTVPAQQST
jgi:DNA polymerase-4